jgi:AcrR family transcriptional regulator
MRPGTARSELAVERGEQVLDAAAAVFARQGYDGSSIDDIADELGATKGRVYHYYRSKSGLLLGVLSTGAQKLIDVVRPIAANESLALDERLLQMAHAHAMMMMTEHSYQKVSLQSFDRLSGEGSQPGEWETVRSLRTEYEALFVDVVDKGRAAGVFHAADTRVVVRGLLGALNWITVWYRPEDDTVASPGRLSKEQIADATARFAVAGAQGAARPPSTT